MSRVLIFWKVLLGLSFSSWMACVVAWFVLLFDICSNPRTADPATQHTAPYSCHGMTVFLTPLQRFVLEWSGLIGVFFMVLSFIIFGWVVYLRGKHAIQEHGG